MNTARSINREEKTIAAMIRIYCTHHHARGTSTCSDCDELLHYARERLGKCPFGAGKPKCSRCRIHCYRPEMRDRIRAVMRFAGPRMLLKHPLLAAAHATQGMGT